MKMSLEVTNTEGIKRANQPSAVNLEPLKTQFRMVELMDAALVLENVALTLGQFLPRNFPAHDVKDTWGILLRLFASLNLVF